MWLALETRVPARLWLLGKITGLLLLPGVLALIPTAWLETHHSLCLIRALTGKSCPGCGMSRAISCALHGEYTRAWRMNRLIVIVLPLLGYVWLRALASNTRRLHAIQPGSDGE